VFFRFKPEFWHCDDCRLHILTYSPFHRKRGKKVFSLDLHQDWHQASRTVIEFLYPFDNLLTRFFLVISVRHFRSCLPAVIGSRLFGFKRNTTLFCGVRKHVSELHANRSSDIILSSFSHWSPFWVPFYPGEQTRLSRSSGPTFWNGLPRNVSHHVLPFNIGISRECHCTGGCRGSTRACSTTRQTRISGIRKNSSVNPFPQ
jgi:hypothetical protein